MIMDVIKKALLVAVWLVAVSNVVAGKINGDQKVLVLVDDLEVGKSHSRLINDIKTLGFDTRVELATSEEVKLQDVDSWLFDKLVVLGGESKFGPGITARKQLEFFESGHDVYLVLSPKSSSSLRALAARLGADLELAGTTIVDHFAYDKHIDNGDHTAVAAVLSDSASRMISTTGGIVFANGIGFSISPEAYMTMDVLHGSPTSFSAKDGKGGNGKSALGGFNLKMAALIQGRNNARAAVIGSVDMLSDEILKKAKGNAGFASESLKWVFQQKSVLKSSTIRHRIIGGEYQPSMYRIKDDVEVFIDIEECTGSACAPYSGTDVQIELVMLDPYIRKTLTNLGNGTFTAKMKVPDVYGVFKWIVDYKRPGLSWIYQSETVPIRPFRHDEYPRFLSQAFPYYSSVLAMTIGFLCTGAFFMYSK